MARNFNGTSDTISAALNLSAYNKITIAFWAINNTNATNDRLFFEFTANANTNSGGFFIDPNSSTGAGNNFQIAVRLGSTTTNSYYANPSAAVWHHIAAILDGSGGTNITLYVDGVFKTPVGSNTLTGSFANDTLHFMCRNAATLFDAGKLADTALWSIGLTATEIAALASGARPGAVRPLSLVVWWPLDGLQSPEPDLSGKKNNATLTGTTSAFGPPIVPFTPRWPQIIPPPPIPPIQVTTRYRYNQNILMTGP